MNSFEPENRDDYSFTFDGLTALKIYQLLRIRVFKSISISIPSRLYGECKDLVLSFGNGVGPSS